MRHYKLHRIVEKPKYFKLLLNAHIIVKKIQ